eukprot:SAG11_NODE_491_length_8977_cov_7.387249_8_plen_100_part_00
MTTIDQPVNRMTSPRPLREVSTLLLPSTRTPLVPSRRDGSNGAKTHTHTHMYPRQTREKLIGMETDSIDTDKGPIDITQVFGNIEKTQAVDMKFDAGEQ